MPWVSPELVVFKKNPFAARSKREAMSGGLYLFAKAKATALVRQCCQM